MEFYVKFKSKDELELFESFKKKVTNIKSEIGIKLNTTNENIKTEFKELLKNKDITKKEYDEFVKLSNIYQILIKNYINE